jgi:DNA polymerase-3 subunit epsilon
MNSLQFNLKKNLVFFDIEATGLNILKDRIIQIALIKFLPGKDKNEEAEYLLNPGVPISEEAFKVHGISVDMVRNKPGFKDIAQELFDWIGDADLAGYNSDRFDIPMLMEEFARVGLQLDISSRKTIDVQKIFYKMEPRTLKAALKMYCEKELTDAHEAMADVKATIDVLKGQLKKYHGVDYIDGDGFAYPSPIKNDISALADFTSQDNQVDVTNRLKYDNKGDIIFNFGKNIGRSVVEVFKQDRQYYKWMMDKDFSNQVKQIITKIMKEQVMNNNV